LFEVIKVKEYKPLYRPKGGWGERPALIVEGESASNSIAFKAVSFLVAIAGATIALPFYFLRGISDIYRELSDD